ncbi:hypothetical protein [uncultured Chryseobacterium sp.]|uniref:hypothetical protein n=1 Tax=uncultured Chryseobacterium sp. TaxID=259322 RepID=UPI0025FE4E83|nr:hypothetical protein [uncultured Chryseobacterium sp.]
MYKLLDKIGFETIEASYGSDSLSSNFKALMKVYNISNDAVEAAYSNPAGRAIVKALNNKYKPIDIVITENKVKMYWIKK